MADIIIVEDTIEIGNLLRDFIIKEGYSACLCVTGEATMEELQKNHAKLVLLDIMLPGMDGFAVCQRIREDSDVPILIVSAKVEKEDKLNGLLLGADDYIEKPIDMDILLAKINGIFKRRFDVDMLIDGNLRIDKCKKQVFINEQAINFTSKEYELLALLIENSGRVLRKEWIFNKIWGFDSFSELQTLTVHIKWLREKIEKDQKDPKRILTVWGTGYRYEKGN